ncbi:transcriptional regulator, partial [Enterobacter hormaechei]|uniref:transcriptional regulator n=1 Tax=Enterobacter hormaechei TaxID=158836 RepID=UPI001D004913
GQNQPRRDDFGLKIGKLSHRTSIKDGLGRHIGSCGPLNRNFPWLLSDVLWWVRNPPAVENVNNPYSRKSA